MSEGRCCVERRLKNKNQGKCCVELIYKIWCRLRLKKGWAIPQPKSICKMSITDTCMNLHMNM